MKKTLYLFLFAGIFLSGCATSVCRHYPAEAGQKDTRGREVIAEVRGKNVGLFLFYGIPIWCGHVRRPNNGAWDTWRNMVRPRDMKEMLRNRARNLGAEEISDIKIREESCGFWSLWILWYRTVSGSALAVEKRGK